MSDLKNLLDDFLESLGQGLTPALEELASEMGDFLINNKDAAQSIGSVLGSAILTVADIVKVFVNNWDLIVKGFVIFASLKVGSLFIELAEAITAATEAETLFNAAALLNPWGLLAAGIGLVLLAMVKYTASVDSEYAAEQKRLALSADIKKFLDDTKDRTEALTVAENEHAQALINTSKVQAEQARIAAETDQKELDRLKQEAQTQFSRLGQSGGSADRMDSVDFGASQKFVDDSGKIKDLTQKIADEKAVATEATQHLGLLEAQVNKLGVAHKTLAPDLETTNKKQKDAIESLKDWLKQQDLKLADLQKEAEAAKSGAAALREQEAVDAAAQEVLKRELEFKKQKLTLSDADREHITRDIENEKLLGEQKKENLKAYSEELDALKKLNEIRSHTEIIENEIDLIDKGKASLNAYKDTVLAVNTALQATKGNIFNPLFVQVFDASLAESQAARTEAILTAAHDRGLKDRENEDNKVNKEIADEQVKDEQEAYNTIAGIFGTVMDQILGVGTGTWKDMLDNWVKQFETFVAQLIAKWAATQFVTSWNSGGNGLTGGSNGGIIGAVGGLFNQGGGTQGAPSTGGTGNGGTTTPPAAGGGGGWGTVAAGAGIGAAVGSQAGIGGSGTIAGAAFGVAATAWVVPVYGWIVAVVAAAIGVIATIVGLISKNASNWAKASIGVKDGEFAVVQLRGAQDRIAYLNPVAEALANGLNQFITAMGGTLEKSSGILDVIGRTGNSKNTDYFVEYGKGLVAHFGQDFQAAMEFATIQALKAAKINGLSTEVTAAIQNSQASTLQALQSDIEFGQKIHDMGLGQIAQAVEHDFQDFQANLARAQALKIPTDNLFTDLASRIQDMRNQILGIHLTPIEQLHHDVDEFNRQLDAQRAQMEQTITTQKLQADSARLQIAVLEAQLQAEGAGASARLSYSRADLEAAGVTATGADLISAALATAKGDLAAAEQAIADAQRVIDALGPDITPDQERDAERRLHKGSGKGNSEVDNLKQMIAQVNKAVSDFKLDPFEKSLSDINKKWDDEIDKLGKNKKAIDEANAAREREIALLKQQTAQQVKNDLKPYQQEMAGEGNYQKQLDDLKEKFAQTMKDAIASGVPKWQVRQANEQANKDLGQQAIASLNLPTVNTINQFKTLTDTLKFLHDNAADLGLTLEQVGQISHDVGTQMFVALADSLEQNINNAAEVAQLNQIKWDLELANYKLQVQLLEAAGILTQDQIDFLNHAISELPELAPANAAANSAAQTNAANTQASAASTQATAANNMAQAIDGLIKFNQSLLTDKALSPLTPQQQLDEARAEFDAIAARARNHDVTAIQELPNAEKLFLEQARSFYGSGGPYSRFFEEIQTLNAQIIGANGGGTTNVGNVVYGAPFGQQPSTSQGAYTAGSSSSTIDLTPVVKAIYDLRSDTNNDLTTIAQNIDKLTDALNRQQGQLNRLANR